MTDLVSVLRLPEGQRSKDLARLICARVLLLCLLQQATPMDCAAETLL